MLRVYLGTILCILALPQSRAGLCVGEVPFALVPSEIPTPAQTNQTTQPNAQSFVICQRYATTTNILKHHSLSCYQVLGHVPPLPLPVLQHRNACAHLHAATTACTWLHGYVSPHFSLK